MRVFFCVAASLAACFVAPSFAQNVETATKPCRVSGFKSELRCGFVQRMLNPANPSAGTIDVHYVVVPATARNKKSDALFFFAGGPGQSAIKVAPQVYSLFSRLNDWRDIVFIDQRGTGKSAPLTCKPDERNVPMQSLIDLRESVSRIKACMPDMQKTPQGKAMEAFTTEIAMQDADAVRAALGYEKINLAGGSYGTRAALDFMRQFPQRVRRVIIDGVAPPDMVLPKTVATDAAAAVEKVLTTCESDARCKSAYPNLRADWQTIATNGVKGTVVNPLTGRDELITLNRDGIEGLVRGPLYVPTVAAVLPFAITEAAHGRLAALIGSGSALNPRDADAMAWGMHFSVICNEDFPRMNNDVNAAGVFAQTYRELCPTWPKAKVSEAFYTIPTAQFPVLVMSGGSDPVTPTRHGERITQALGANAKHIIVPHAGHGVMGIGCMRDVMHKFLNAKADADALDVDAKCVINIPRPTAWVMPGSAK